MVPEINDTIDRRSFDEQHVYFYDMMHDFLFILDSEGKIVKINKAVRDRLGYSIEDLYNKPVLVMHPPERRDEAAKIVIRMLKGETDSCNVPILTKDGNLVPVETKITKGKIENKDILIGISRDISERIKAEEALLKEKQLTEMALNTQTDTFFVFDPSTGIPLRWNKAFCYISGYSNEEISRLKAPDTYYDKEDLNKLSEAIKLIKRGETTVNNVNLKTKDGKFIPFEYAASGIFDEKNNLKYIVAVGRNITDRKLAEKKIRESELKFRRIFEAIPDLYFLVSGDTTIFDYKGNIEQFYIPPESFMGKKITDIMPVNIGKESLVAVQKTIETREPQIIEYDLDFKSKTFTFEARHLYLSEDQILIFIRDITKRKKAQQKLIESENNFRDLYEEAPNAYFSIDTNGIIKNCNKAAGDLLDYTKEELLRMKVLDLYAKNENGVIKAKELFKRFLKATEIKNEELQMERKNGELIWVNLNVKPILDHKGKVIESRSMIINIDDRKKIDEKIADIARFPSENPHPVLRANTELVLYINQSGSDILNIAEGSKTPEFLTKYIEESLDLNKIQEFEITISNHIYSFILRPIKEYGYANLYGRDITERKNALDDLKTSETNYRKAYDRVNFYKDLIAHDLNNILQSILSSVELYSLFNKDLENAKNIDDLFQIINESALRGAKIISNVQKLSKLEDSKLTIQELNLCDFLTEAINFTKNKYKNRDITIQTEGSSKVINVLANELLLDVFENILINAVKYNDNERIEILIRISLGKKKNIEFVKLEFIDNGMGVEDSRKDKILEVGNREFKGGRGMGMGLSLVKKAIESYGGEIYIKDKIKGDFSNGSNFILFIPKS